MARTLLVAALMLVARQGQGQFAPGPNPITGTVTASQTLSSGTGTINSGATLSVSGSANAVNVTGNSIVVNNGTIRQTGTGRGIRDNVAGTSLIVSNNAGALVQAADSDAFQMNQANNSVRWRTMERSTLSMLLQVVRRRSTGPPSPPGPTS